MSGLHETIGLHVTESRTLPLSSLDLDSSRYAIFLDFDGVIADIAPRPDAVTVPEFRASVVADLRRATEGALALVSGREIDDIRSVFPGYEGAASGGHGAETEWPDGTRESATADPASIESVREAMRSFADTREGLLFETKRLGGVLHYRADPSLEEPARRMVETLLEDHPALELQVAKMAFEVKPAGFSKGSVIEAFMARAPFAGRVPFYAGDDVTDEAAFEVVNGMGGTSVKVGEGATCASYRADSPSDLFAWLGSQLEPARAATH